MESVLHNNEHIYTNEADKMIEEVKKKSRIKDLLSENCKIEVRNFQSYSYMNKEGWIVHLYYPTNLKDVPNCPGWFSSNSPMIYDPYEVQCLVDELKKKLGILKEESFSFEKIKSFNWNYVFFILFLFGIIFICNEIGQVIGQNN